MSMIENQVSILKELAELQNISYHKSIINRAADTIEALSEKLAAENTERSESYYNDGWIYCGDGKNTPEKTGFYMVTKEIRETGERFTGKGHFDTEKKVGMTI